ncbi:MAG: methylenetetrahydrofolate reductase C-terminal domain-containing protein [Pseudonocardiaceae bacterium]
MPTRKHLDRIGAAPERRHAGWPTPVTPSVSAPTLYRLHYLLAPNPVYRRLAAWLERNPTANRLFTAAEERIKGAIFGCRMCGQCALPATGYACPMTCPKQLRNGPCGGVSPTGMCEVNPDVRCVWLVAFERAEAEGRVEDLSLLQRPIDHRQWGRSSWVNYWQGRDEGMWTSADGRRQLPIVHRNDPGKP